MAHQDLTSYLAPYACALPASTREHKVIQAKLFATLRNEKATNAAKEHAKFKLLCLNVRMILKIALTVAKKCNDAVDIEDLLQVGQLALYEAMETFNPNRGVLLISYCGLGIQRAMERAIGDNVEDAAPCRIPAYRQRQLGKVKFAIGELTKEGRDTHDADAILEKVHARKEKTSKSMKLKDVEACLELVPQSKTTALNAPIGGDSDSRQLVEVMPSDIEAPDHRSREKQAMSMFLERCERVQAALEQMTEDEDAARDVDIFQRRYGMDYEVHTLDAAGKTYDLSRERARQITEAMLKKLSEATGLTRDAIVEALEAYAEGLARLAA